MQVWVLGSKLACIDRKNEGLPQNGLDLGPGHGIALGFCPFDLFFVCLFVFSGLPSFFSHETELRDGPSVISSCLGGDPLPLPSPPSVAKWDYGVMRREACAKMEFIYLLSNSSFTYSTCQTPCPKWRSWSLDQEPFPELWGKNTIHAG